MSRKISTTLLAIIACFLWATAFPELKIGLKYNTPIAFAGTRFILSGLIILPFTCKPSKYIATIRQNWRLLMLLTFIQGFLHYIFFYNGINMVPGALGAIINGAQPLIVALLAAYMITGEPLTIKRTATLITGMAGVVFVSLGRHALHIGTSIELIGALLVMASNFTSAYGNIIIAKNGRHINPLVISSFTLTTGGAALLLVSIPFEGITYGPFPTEYWISLSWLSMISAVAFSLWYNALQQPGVKVSDLNLWKFIIPVVGAILSWVILPDERPNWITVSGMAIITISLILFFKSNGSTSKNKKIDSAHKTI